MYHTIQTVQDFEAGSCKPGTNTAKSSDPPHFLTKQELLSVMARYFQTVDYALRDFSFQEIKGSSPLTRKGEHWELEVVMTNSRNQERKYKFLVKRLPTEWTYCYEKFVSALAFQKEVEVYSAMLEDFVKAENDITRHERWSPSYFYSKPGQILVLEHPTDKGYFQVNRRECLDKEHLLAVMRALASFHAACIKFEQKVAAGTLHPKAPNFVKSGDKVTAGDIYGHLDFEAESAGLECHPENVYLEAGIRALVNMVDHLPGYSSSEMEHIKSQLPGLLRKSLSMRQSSKRHQNVFIHGDLSPNNLFFRKKGEGLEAILIDYRHVRYAPPSYDLLMLLFLNQRRAFRIKEMQHLIQAYYQMFSHELGKSDIAVQTLLSLKDFTDCCEEGMKWARLMASLRLQTILLPDEALEKYLISLDPYNDKMVTERSGIIAETFSKDELYRARMIEIMSEVIKTCIMP